MKATEIKYIEPFAYGYINSPIDDPEYRIAYAMYNRAKYGRIFFEKQDTFATYFDRQEEIGVKYLSGDGITVSDHYINIEKQKYPLLEPQISEYRDLMRKVCQSIVFQESKSHEEKLLTDGKNIMWGGDWGGHGNPDYHLLLHLGTTGLRNRNETYRKVNPGKDVFYDSLNLVLDALDLFGQRTKELASEYMNESDDADVKKRMQKVIDAFENIPMNPPRDFFEALQMFWLAFTFEGIDSPGLFDYTMGDYYTLTPENERKQLLEEMWQLFHKTRTWNLCIGRSDENGNYICNELTYDILEVARKYKYNTPNLTMRINSNTPDDLWESAILTIASGIGMPVLYNDDVVCPALEELGICSTDSHMYCMNGCNQFDIFGKSHMGLEDGEVSLAKALELALHNGYSPKHGNKIVPETGDVSTFATFEDLFGAYKKQVEYLTDRAVELSNKSQKLRAEIGQNPLRSSLIYGCAEKGLDYRNRGPIYGHGQILTEGIADTADSLTAIKHFVYDEKKYTLETLRDALLCDFEGYDDLYYDFSNYHKFGNDIQDVDQMASLVVDHFYDYLATKRTYRGGIYGGGCSTFNRAARYGAAVGALPCGKKSTQTLFADSIGSVPGFDEKGPTALINSTLCYNQTKAKSGFVLNLKFNKDTFVTQKGRKAFEALAKTYFENGGQNLSVAVLSTQELRDAQENPELHKNLIVRVGGYSDYFNNLPKDLQDNIIARSELVL